jgi:hypothetical protein
MKKPDAYLLYTYNKAYNTPQESVDTCPPQAGDHIGDDVYGDKDNWFSGGFTQESQGKKRAQTSLEALQTSDGIHVPPGFETTHGSDRKGIFFKAQQQILRIPKLNKKGLEYFARGLLF